MSATAPDPVEILSRLIACPSVTPDDAGAFATVEGLLGAAGWRTERVTFSAPGTPDVENLIATRGEGGAAHRLLRPCRRRAARRCGAVEPPALLGRGRRWLRPRPRRRRHEGRHRRLHRGRLAVRRGAGRPGGNRDAPPHRRRGGPLGQRHRQAPRPCAAGRGCASMRPSSASRRRGRGSATWSRSAGAAASRPRSGSPAGRATSPIPHLADNPVPALIRLVHRLTDAQARRGQHRFPAVESRSDQRRCRQSRRQRHPGRGDRPVQRPLQRPLVAPEPHRLPPRRARCGRRRRAL